MKKLSLHRHFEITHSMGLAFYVVLIILGCYGPNSSQTQVVNSPELSPVELTLPVQTMSALGCEDGKVKITQCTATRIASNSIVSAGHCFKPGRDYYILSDFNLMKELRTIRDQEGEPQLTTKIDCDLFEQFIATGVEGWTIEKIASEAIFLTDDYLEIRNESHSSPKKIANDIAVVRTVDAAILDGYMEIPVGRSPEQGSDAPLRIYGLGISTCYEEEDGSIRKVYQSELDPKTKRIGIGRVDGRIASFDELNHVVEEDYIDLRGLDQVVSDQSSFFDAALFVRMKRENFTCQGDSGGGIINFSGALPEIVGVHRGSIFEPASVEVPYSVGARLDSEIACQLFADAGVEIRVCSGQ